MFPHLYPHEERDAPGSGALIAADAKIKKTRGKYARVTKKQATPKRPGEHI